MISLCVPVIKRYDLLANMLRSAQGQIGNVYIIDNGKNESAVTHAMRTSGLAAVFHVMEPQQPLGVAAAWNWFITHVPEERLLCVDDIALGPDTVRTLVSTPGDFVTAHAFNCFLVRDSCVKKIGLFDEEISPGYLYFEDTDYQMRLEEADIPPIWVPCGVTHRGSQTLAAFTPEEMKEHHRKFRIATANYIKKHGHKAPVTPIYDGPIYAIPTQ